MSWNPGALSLGVSAYPAHGAIAGVVAQRSIEALFVAAGIILTVTSAATLAARPARELD